MIFVFEWNYVYLFNVRRIDKKLSQCKTDVSSIVISSEKNVITIIFLVYIEITHDDDDDIQTVQNSTKIYHYWCFHSGCC